MIFSEYLEARPFERPSPLFAGDAGDLIGKLAPVLGRADVGQLILECAMLGQNDGGDFSVQITRAGLESFLAAFEGEEAREWKRRSDIWARTWEFCVRWKDSPDFSGITDIWLEFDYEALMPDIPLPCVYFDANNTSADTALSGPAAVLLGAAPARGVYERLLRVAESLGGVGLFQLGVMLSRDENPRPVRLFTNEMPAGEVLPFLSGAGWGTGEERSRLGEFLDWAGGYSNGRYDVSFGVHAEGLTDKLGVSISPPPGGGPLGKMTAALMERGWASPEKSAATEGWIRQRDVPAYANDISHFKFPFEGKILGAKVYLRHAPTLAAILMQSRW